MYFNYLCKVLSILRNKFICIQVIFTQIIIIKTFFSTIFTKFCFHFLEILKHLVSISLKTIFLIKSSLPFFILDSVLTTSKNFEHETFVHFLISLVNARCRHKPFSSVSTLLNTLHPLQVIVYDLDFENVSENEVIIVLI